jgi:aspartate/methionine/tyrosine aminotransferase
MLYEGREHMSLIRYPSIRDRVILLDGWSKTYAMTGWRLGYGVWPRKLIEFATRLAINCHSCVNAAAQYAGIAALDGPQDCVSEMLSAFTVRRRTVVDRLNGIPGLSCVAPGGAFYAFPNVTATGLTAKELEVTLLDRVGVATIAGTGFGRHGEGFLRLSYANSMENIAEAMARIASLLPRLQA